jgi:hypothetical protein
VRETNHDTALLITQENHAELLAQLAAHWRNQKFSKLEPYDSMVSATLHHDSHEREQLKEDCILPIPVVDDKQNEAPLRITPVNKIAGQIAAYPSDLSPLKIGLPARTLSKRDFPSEERCRQACLKAPRGLLHFQITW